jgi:serine protease AprX
LFPITINGYTLDQSKPDTKPLKTKYILVQSRARLSPSDRQELDHAGVKHLDYVSKNTYLCQYQDGDLEKIRQLEPVVYVDIYRKEFKIMPSLKKAERDEAKRNQAYKVDFVFHKGVDPSSQDLQRDIKEKSHCGVGDIEFLPNKARLTVQSLYLKAVASIDDVRHVEEVGEVVEFNNVARQILKIDL